MFGHHRRVPVRERLLGEREEVNEGLTERPRPGLRLPELNEHEEQGARHLLVVVADGRERVGQGPLRADETQAGTVGQRTAGRLPCLVGLGEAIELDHLLRRRVGRRLDGRHAQPIALVLHGVHAQEAILDDPVLVERPEHRGPDPVPALLFPDERDEAVDRDEGRRLADLSDVLLNRHEPAVAGDLNLLDRLRGPVGELAEAPLAVDDRAHLLEVGIPEHESEEGVEEVLVVREGPLGATSRFGIFSSHVEAEIG